MIVNALLAAAAAPAFDASAFRWYPASNLTVRGQFGWDGAKLPNPFARLPSHAEGTVRSPVWGLSRDAAGVQVGFMSNATSISVRWRTGESSCVGEATVESAALNRGTAALKSAALNR